MNLFVWGNLREKGQISFILRRNYRGLLEPAELKNWALGDYHPTFLFQSNETHLIAGDIAPELTTRDFIYLDIYHAVAKGVHSRIIRPVEVVRAGKKETAQAHVYVAGPSFSKMLTKLGA